MEKSRENLFYYNFWLEFRIYRSISKLYYLSKKKVMPCACSWSEQSKAMIAPGSIEKGIEKYCKYFGESKCSKYFENVLQIFWQMKVFEIIWIFLKIFWQIVLHCKNDFCNQFTAADGDIVITGASNYSKCQLQYRALIVTIPRRCWR